MTEARPQGYYYEKHVGRLMQEDLGSQEEWDRVHKRALYWSPPDSVILKQQPLDFDPKPQSSIHTKRLPIVYPIPQIKQEKPPTPSDELTLFEVSPRPSRAKAHSKIQITNDFIKLYSSCHIKQIQQERRRGFIA